MSKENNYNEDLSEFLQAVDNLVGSKYILIDRRISELLRSIAGNDRIYNLVAECMVNFDFIEEWRNAIKMNRLVLPNSDDAKVSFVFCMLNNIDDKNLDLTKVLEHYFSFDETRTPYEVFCNDIVLEFKNIVLSKLGVKQPNEVLPPEAAEEALEPVETLQTKLVSTLAEMRKLISSMRKPKFVMYAREDVLAVISTFEYAARNNQSEYFYALLLTLSVAVSKLKEVKPHLAQVDTLARNLIKRNQL